MEPARLGDRLRYAFDNSMSRGATALIGYLGVVCIVLIAFFALLVSLLRIAPAGEENPSFLEALWLSLMRTLDPGTMGGDAGWAFRVTMLGVTLGGIFLVSSLIGVINNGIDEKLDQLRKGRSMVLEKDHTLILGWSPKIFTILSERALANENRSKPKRPDHRRLRGRRHRAHPQGPRLLRSPGRKRWAWTARRCASRSPRTRGRKRP
jgi:hypothetical protein